MVLVLALLAAVPDFLLPADAAPVACRLELRIDPTRTAFSGTARIDVDLRKSARVIWLNAADLAVHQATVEVHGQVRTARAEPAGGEFLGLHVAEPVGPGRATLMIRYQARFGDNPPVGLFRRNIDGEWYAFTTFTPIDARRAFPCFDEPRFKTPWKLTIHVRPEHQAVANSPVERTVEEAGGWKAVEFATTEPLPAEVVAFAVGPLERLDGGAVGQGGVRLGVIAPRNRGADGGPALSATRQVLPRLEAYTGLPYPYRKLDHLAMPDGAFSATENPGLIAYRQDSLLVPPDQATPARLRALRALQAHELAHQWFGNLVTQAAWDDVWLSEGFATWLSARVMDTEEPPARRRLRAVAARERIMEADAGERAMPVRRALNSRRQMAGVYNRFVYQKGAAVLLMLEGWLGDDRFRDGVRAYLQRHRFAAATTADLATALRQASGADPAAVMSSFLNQAGIPSLRVRTACDAGAAPRLVVEQGGPARRWSVPVCWTGDAAARACAVVDQPRQEIELNGSSGCPAWLFPNAGGTGYYRIEWTPKQLATLEPGALAAGERLTLVYDLRALKRAGRLEATGAKLLARLADDAEPDIARAAREALGKVNSAGTPNP